MSQFDKETKRDVFFAQRDREIKQFIDPRTGKVRADLVNKVRCLLCDQDDCRYLFSKDGFDFVRCHHCSHVYVNPQMDEAKIVEHYNEDSETNDLAIEFMTTPRQEETNRQNYNYFFDFIQNKIPARAKFLDVGCSTGLWLSIAKAKGHEVVGMELNKKAGEIAHERFGIEVVPKLLDEVDWPDQSFDVISMFGVIEHLVHPVADMKIVNRLLKPGGIFLGICPNVQSLVVMVLHEQSRTFTGRLHLSYFSDKTLRYLFNKTGFKQVDISTHFHGRESLLNYFQLVDPFGEDTFAYLPDKFRAWVTDLSNWPKIEAKMHELGIGLKLRFFTQK